jgi:hypothetical protein
VKDVISSVEVEIYNSNKIKTILWNLEFIWIFSIVK